MKELPQMKWFFKSFVLVLFLTLNLSAFWWNGGGSGSGSGSSEEPKNIVIDGDKIDDDSPTQYYKFYSTVNQNVITHITDHDETTETCCCGACITSNKDLTLTLYNLNSDGSCDTSTSLGSHTQDGEFNWSFNTNASKSYCLKASGNGRYDIHLTSDATLKAAIADASKREDKSPMTFVVALTKASSSNVTINYTFTDDSAVNGTNYQGTDGSVTIPAGSLGADINVTLHDKDITESKYFNINISSSDVSIDSDSDSAKGTILSSGLEEYDGYDGPDICYDSRETSGFCMFGSCMFYQERTNVRSMVNGLEDIDIKKALTRGMAFMDFASGIGIDDTSKTLKSGDDTAEKKTFVSGDFHGYFNVGMFPKGINYRVGTGANSTDGGSLDKDDTTSYYDKSMFKFGLFTQYTTLVTYTKGGKTYQEVLQACNPDTYGSLSAKPVLDDCGIFLGALNSATKVSFNSTKTQSIEYQTELNTPAIDGSSSCSGSACTADGVGSGTLTLPSFMHSSKSNFTNIPYSMVVAEQHVGNLVVNTDAKTEDPEDNRTIVFEAPYSSSYGGRVMLIDSITDRDNHANKYHYVFKEGDYWIGNWVIDKSKDVTIETAGKVRFFILSDFNIKTTTSGEIRIGYHPDSTSTCSDPHFYMYLYGNFSIDAAGSAHIKNGYIYSKGTISIGGSGAFASYYSAITADKELSIDTVGSGEYSAYISSADGMCKDSDSSSAGLFEECPAGALVYLTGPYDAWDTFRDASTPPSDRNISTKVVNKSFTLALANIDNAGTGYTVSEDVKVAIYPRGSNIRISDEVTFNAKTSPHETVSFNVTKASLDAAAGFVFCAEYDGSTYTISELASCSGAIYDCNATTTDGNPTWHLCYSSDNFAIRPDRFSITEIATPIIAGQNKTFSVEATQSGGGATVDYNVSNTDYSLSLSDIKYKPDNSIDVSLNGVSSLSSYSFVNGASSAFNLQYSDIGKVNIKFEDRHWADVDIDDTPASCLDNQSFGSLTIPNGRYICGDTNATFIPSYFIVEDAKLYNDENKTTTYLSNDLNISAKVVCKITAKNDINQTTQNFDAASWENPISATMAVSTASTPTIIKSEISTAKIGFANGVATITDDESNASKNILFNYTRAKNKPLNPFRVKGADINLSVSSAYTGITITQKTTPSVDKNATFVYGRTHATKQRYTDDNGTALIYFESYCFRTDADGVACDKTLLPNGTSSARTNDIRWYVNANHDASKQGVVGNITERGGDAVTASSATSANPASTTLTYDTTKGYGHPYRTTMENNASSWLIYSETDSSATTNEFSVEFEGGNSGWSGAHETDVTTTDNMTKKTNRRSMW